MQDLSLKRILVLSFLLVFCLTNLSFAQDNKESNSREVDARETNDRNSKESATSKGDSKDEATDDSSNEDNGSKDTEEATKDEGDSKDESDKSKDEERTKDKSDDGGDNSDGEEESFDESYDITGQYGSFILTTPDQMTVPSPQFAINEKVIIGWKLGNFTDRPPKKISICGRLPQTTSLINECDWMIATNISGTKVNATWDTKTNGPPGRAFLDGTGYNLYIFDSDLGLNTVPMSKKGVARTLNVKFGMYRSAYNRSNEGVPVGYDPNAATAPQWHGGLALVVVFASVVGIVA